MHAETIIAKLRAVGRHDLAAPLASCHQDWTVCRCNACGKVQRFPNRCETFLCPRCIPRLSHDRVESIRWWSERIKQPKHVVLTVRNIPDLTSGHIDELRDWFTKLRRRKFARSWGGGCYTIECTNESRGWHLHLHILVDCRYVDKIELERTWSLINGALGYIVDVTDCRRTDYLRRVVRYVTKGHMLASWSGEQIAQFADAFRGKRTFGVFGSLYGQRTEFSEWLAQLRASRPKCECGSDDCSFFTEFEWHVWNLDHTPGTKPRPPAPVAQQHELIPEPARWPD